MKPFPLWAICTIMLATLGMTACDINKGPAEKAGEKIDNVIEDTGEAIENAGDNT
ncbi:MAG: hypothetical protein KBT63_07880 [Porticoccaceae bacterium]|nr:hypothetical protein [Porticoccaceae bacterium]